MVKLDKDANRYYIKGNLAFKRKCTLKSSALKLHIALMPHLLTAVPHIHRCLFVGRTELHAVVLGVDAIVFKELVVSSLLLYPAIFHHDDLVRIANGR